MLNPESVDINPSKTNEVRILFTDDEGDEAVIIAVGKTEAWRLHKMLQETLNGNKERYNGIPF